MTRLRVPVTVAVFAFAFTARADITYTINDTVGAGTVTGTITTDGFLGTLATSDIIDWNLVLTNGFGTTLDLNRAVGDSTHRGSRSDGRLSDSF